MNAKGLRSYLSFTGLGIGLVLLILANGVVKRSFSSFSIDLTEEGLYSLSPGTIQVLQSIEEPITLQFFFSKTDAASVPALGLYADRVRDLLSEYERRAGGAITLSHVDPRPDSEEETWAQKFGLRPIPLPTGQRLYFGLVGINAFGTEEVITIFDVSRQSSLEYDVTKLLNSLLTESQLTVGVLSPLDVTGAPFTPVPGQPQKTAPSQPWVFASQLESLAKVRAISWENPTIDETVDVLLVVHPKSMSEKARYLVDQFVMRGGTLIVLLDPFCVRDIEPGGSPMATGNNASSLNELTEKWGVTLRENAVVADIGLSTKVSAGRGAPPQEFAMWLSLGGGQLSRDNQATAAVENVVLPWSGVFDIKPIEGIQSEVIARTTKQASISDRQTASLSRSNPTSVLRGYVPDGEELPLATILSGTFQTNFPGGKPASVREEIEHRAESLPGARIALIADVDFISDPFAASVRNFFGQQVASLLNDNIVLAHNLIELLAGSDALISIRSRGNFSRPFTRVQEIERRAELRWKNEEARLQAKLSAVNDRLKQLQGATSGGDGRQVFGSALLNEIKEFQAKRAEAQQRLREVRRGLRQEKESLGTMLFIANTFLMPALIILLGLVALLLNRRSKKGAEA